MNSIYILSLFALFFVPGSVKAIQENGTRPISVWIESPRINIWGAWEDVHLCPEDTFVTGFRVKNHPDAGLFVDDTSLNGVELVCSSPSAVNTSLLCCYINFIIFNIFYITKKCGFFANFFVRDFRKDSI